MKNDINEMIVEGMDGWIRVWYYETIDQADPLDDHRFIDVEPIYEFKIGDDEDENESLKGSVLMSILKKNPDDPEQSLWYAQVSQINEKKKFFLSINKFYMTEIIFDSFFFFFVANF